MGYAKIACEVFAHFEIFDVLVEWYSTACLRVSFAFPTKIDEPKGCGNPVALSTTMTSGRCALPSTTATATPNSSNSNQ